MALTPKQRMFVKEYLVDLNATQAAIRAGYSPKTAYSAGQRLLKEVEIQNAVQSAMDERGERVKITQDRVLLEYARIAFFDSRKLFQSDGSPKDIQELDDDTAAALSGMDVVQEVNSKNQTISYIRKYRIANKLGALDSLAKHLGMFERKNGIGITNDNNLLEAIQQREVNTDDLPEVE